MKKPAVLWACLLLLLGLAVGSFLWKQRADSTDKELKEVAITQIASHPSLDEVREGVIDGLQKRGYRDGTNIRITFRNANGDASLALPIAEEFARKQVTVVVPITTPSALAAAKSTTTIPIVFGGVTFPEKVGLVQSIDHPGGNVTGTSDRWPFRQQLDLFKAILPRLKRLGVLYRPGDDVSAFALEQLRAQAVEHGVEIEARAVSTAADVYPSAVALLKKTDALYAGMDNLVVENIASLVKAGREAQKPVFAGDEGAVKKGALASVSVSMRKLGELTGEMVADVLEGKKPADMPVQVLSEGRAVANRRAAQAFGVDESHLEKIGVLFLDGDPDDGNAK